MMEKKDFPKYVIIILLIMGSFGVMGGGLVSPGLATIGTAFNAPREQFGYILSVYTLSAAISLPIIGYYIDAVGRRKVGLTCLVLDGTAGVSIIFANSFTHLLILRFIQGIGIAGLVPVTMTIISDLFSGKRRLQIIGYLTGTISLGAVIIPTIGGVLASLDWRLVFGVYGFSLILALFFFFTLQETSPRDTSHKNRHNSMLHYLSSIFSVLRIREIRNIMMHSLAIYFFLYTLVTFLPLYLVIEHGRGEVFSGFALSLQGTFSALLASQAERVDRYLNWRKRASTGYILIALCFLLLPLWPRGSPLISVSFIIYGIGTGIISPTVYNRVIHLSPPGFTGSVIAIFNTMKYTGMTLSPFIVGFALIYNELDGVFIGVATLAILCGVATLTK